MQSCEELEKLGQGYAAFVTMIGRCSNWVNVSCDMRCMLLRTFHPTICHRTGTLTRIVRPSNTCRSQGFTDAWCMNGKLQSDELYSYLQKKCLKNLRLLNIFCYLHHSHCVMLK